MNILNKFSIEGRRAIVVGGCGDLGRGMTEALVEAGARCAVVDIDDSKAAFISELSKIGPAVRFIRADIGNRDSIRSSFADALGFLGGKVDILVNSAGIQRRFPSEDFPEKDWDDVLAINLSSLFFFSQLAAREMIKAGKGKIINVASMQSFFGGITIPAYAASKGGVAQLTRALSNDWAAKGICVNAIAPGYMDTQLNVKLVNDPTRSAEILARIPMRRWGRGDDLKGLALFLASDASDYVSGAVIPVDGGFLGR
jgi:2-deoxy-D-gluconate 3-dehydrogenase